MLESKFSLAHTKSELITVNIVLCTELFFFFYYARAIILGKCVTFTPRYEGGSVK